MLWLDLVPVAEEQLSGLQTVSTLQEKMGSVQGLRRGFAGGAGQVGGGAWLSLAGQERSYHGQHMPVVDVGVVQSYLLSLQQI